MKENGIGRPSSRAAIIEKIIARGYILRTGKSLMATPKGIELMGLIHEPLLKSSETTGYWEKHLREIERGQYNPDTFLAELITQLLNIILRVKDAPAATVHAFISVRKPPVTRNRSFSGRSASRRARR
jgi:DNA topoisomerase-3